ncbi:MAG: hypothetical protein H6R10_1020 [Rhodocyclaceae bacterium]|nr:hypothetical protein [Rhodocyclaceae bacterium]
MASLRSFLLVLALLFAQGAAVAHAVEHGATKDGALPGHVCELCLATCDLGSVLPGVAAPPPVVASVLVPEAMPYAGRGQLPPPSASQRGPPAA